jgi:multiple sugar transport system substrate-binding protein
MPSRRQGWDWQLVAAVLAVGTLGCDTQRDPQAHAQPFRGVTITVGAVGSRDQAILGVVAAQRGEWAASRGAEVVIRSGVDAGSAHGIDVLVFAGDRLGDLVDAGALLVLPETLVVPPAKLAEGADEPGEARSTDSSAGDTADADALRFAGIVPALRDQVARYGKDRMAFPIGGTALVLVYDRTAFEREANREAAGKASLVLKPPETWEELDALARFFQGRDWDGDGTPDHGIALAFGRDPEFLGEAIFLARAASLAQHRDQYSFLFDHDTMRPRIDTPPFVMALEALVRLKASGPPGATSFDADAARQAFRGGKVALLIDRAEMAARWSHGKAAIGVAPLPGSPRVYDPAREQWEDVKPANDPSYLPSGGGWLVGVSRTTAGKTRDAAIDFARYLISPETASRLRANGTFPMLAARSRLLAQGPPDPRATLGVDARRWSDAVNDTLIRRGVVPGVRIPQADGYLGDLARQRLAVLGEEHLPAEAALREVARSWATRTQQLGTERQAWHYRRSLNVLSTAAEPPGR